MSEVKIQIDLEKKKAKTKIIDHSSESSESSDENKRKPRKTTDSVTKNIHKSLVFSSKSLKEK